MGRINFKLATSVLTIVVLLIMLMTVLAETSTEVASVSNNFSITNDSACTNGVCPTNVYPLASFFKKNGLILLMFIVGIVLVMSKGLSPSKK